MRWFFPATNGDHRLEPHSDSACRLIITLPSAGETEMLTKFLAKAARQKNKAGNYWTGVLSATGVDQEVILDVPVSEAGKLLLKFIKPRAQAITAVRFESGKIAVAEAADESALHKLVSDKPALLARPESYRKPGAAPRDAAEPAETKERDEEPPKPEPKKDKAEVAVTTARPTPSCPQCIEGAVDRASEVLLSFLTPGEHASWASDRVLEVTGGLSGHRYLIAHRHSELAQRWGRICFDLDDAGVLHFHDWSVPPEEEVLAAKLILEHREPWLRNEATCLFYGAVDAAPTITRHHGLWFDPVHLRFRWQNHVETVTEQHRKWGFTDVFKNPFGDGLDGVWDANLTREFGRGLLLSLTGKDMA